jgi:hypothetical protein
MKMKRGEHPIPRCAGAMFFYRPNMSQKSKEFWGGTGKLFDIGTLFPDSMRLPDQFPKQDEV